MTTDNHTDARIEALVRARMAQKGHADIHDFSAYSGLSLGTVRRLLRTRRARRLRLERIEVERLAWALRTTPHALLEQFPALSDAALAPEREHKVLTPLAELIRECAGPPGMGGLPAFSVRYDVPLSLLTWLARGRETETRLDERTVERTACALGISMDELLAHAPWLRPLRIPDGMVLLDQNLIGHLVRERSAALGTGGLPALARTHGVPLSLLEDLCAGGAEEMAVDAAVLDRTARALGLSRQLLLKHAPWLRVAGEDGASEKKDGGGRAPRTSARVGVGALAAAFVAGVVVGRVLGSNDLVPVFLPILSHSCPALHRILP